MPGRGVAVPTVVADGGAPTAARLSPRRSICWTASRGLSADDCPSSSRAYVLKRREVAGHIFALHQLSSSGLLSRVCVPLVCFLTFARAWSWAKCTVARRGHSRSDRASGSCRFRMGSKAVTRSWPVPVVLSAAVILSIPVRRLLAVLGGWLAFAPWSPGARFSLLRVARWPRMP